MKKLLLLVACVSLSTTFVNAQRMTFGNPSNTDGRTDTVINGTTTYLKASLNQPSPLGLGILCSKNSGTVSGTCYLEATCDLGESPTSYVILDSVVLANQTTNSALRSYAMNVYPKMRWRIVTTGTQNFIVRAWFNK